MNSIVLRDEKDKFLLNILYGDDNNYFELLNISSESNNSYYKPNEDLMDLKIISNINSLFKLSNNLLVFSYYSKEFIIKYLKIARVTINLISDIFYINYKYNNTFITYDCFNSTSCFETTNYINCLYLTPLKYKLEVVIFDKYD